MRLPMLDLLLLRRPLSIGCGEGEAPISQLLQVSENILLKSLCENCSEHAAPHASSSQPRLELLASESQQQKTRG